MKLKTVPIVLSLLIGLVVGSANARDVLINNPGSLNFHIEERNFLMKKMLPAIASGVSIPDRQKENFSDNTDYFVHLYNDSDDPELKKAIAAYVAVSSVMENFTVDGPKTTVREAEERVKFLMLCQYRKTRPHGHGRN